LAARAIVVLLLFGIIPAHALHTTSAQARKTKSAAEVQASSYALFARSDLARARSHAEHALKSRAHDRDALFLLMETAALQADTRTELSAAIGLCSAPSRADDRTLIASFRILDLAANTAQFRSVVPDLERILRRRNDCEENLRAALLTAVMDGLPGGDPSRLAHESGLAIDWRVAGPFGRYRNLDFDQHWSPEDDELRFNSSSGHRIERIHAIDGTFHLPEYFAREGVYYASTTFLSTRPGRQTLRVESPGTLEIWVDGVLVMKKDDRFQELPEVICSDVIVAPGAHRVLLKFITSALPFRVAILPRERKRTARLSARAPEIEQYISAEKSYWQGDYRGVVAKLTDLRGKDASAAVDFLLAQTWHQQSEDSQEEERYLKSAVQRSEDAFAVQYALALRAYEDGDIDEAIHRLRVVLDQRPQFLPAQELAARVAKDNHWPVEAQNAFETLTQVHPSCAIVREAHDFYVSQEDFTHARATESQLATCGPGSLDLAEVLSAAGKHDEASQAALDVVNHYPFDRAGRAVLVRELSLAGRSAEAQEAANQLIALAPNSADYRALAAEAERSADAAVNTAAPVTAAVTAFYQPLRHDGAELVHQAAAQQFHSSAVRLLDQKVIRLDADGSFDVYVHRTTRILDRSAIQQYGELSIPPDVSLLELRTVQADGTVSEPELDQNKQTISMPALVPGSSVDLEYTVHLDPHSIVRAPDQFTFTFGSFHLPVMNSSFAFIAPANANGIYGVVSSNAPQARIIQWGGERIELWQAQDLSAAKAEADVPPGSGLPAVTLVLSPARDWRGIQSAYRDWLIDSIRVGANVREVAERLANGFQEDIARDIYRYVQHKIKNDGGSLVANDLTNAEDTLAGNSGSPTLAMLALARARGLNANLILARSVATQRTQFPSLVVYDRPLVELTFDHSSGQHRTVLLDLEDDTLPFGVIAPDLQLSDALFVPTERSNRTEDPIVALDPDRRNIENVARGDIFISENGDLRANMKVSFSDWRSADLRASTNLKDGAQQLLDRVASNFLKNAQNVSGTVINEVDKPLTAELVFSIPHFWDFRSDAETEIARLISPLDLKQRYIQSSARQFSLYVNSPNNGEETLRIHLPAGTRLGELPAQVDLRTEFGNFQMSVQQISADEFEIRRSFSIPVELVPPNRYPEFAKFTDDIQGAEHARLPLVSKDVFVANRKAH